MFSGLFPRDNARDTRFAINFFTSIGLGGLTDGLRGGYNSLEGINADWTGLGCNSLNFHIF